MVKIGGIDLLELIMMQMIGVGTALMMPLIGNLSDEYGRKALLTLPMTLSIIPLGMLPLLFFSFLLLSSLAKHALIVPRFHLRMPLNWVIVEKSGCLE